MNGTTTCVVLGLVALAATLMPQPAVAAPTGGGGVPRVYVSGRGHFSTLDAMLDELARADVVLVGERHDSRAGHVLERTILEGLFRRRSSVTLSMEMLERDVQAIVDGYVGGRLEEAAFMERSRPWPDFAASWKPLVDFAREKKLPVLAANVPRSLAGAVASSGLAALRALPVHVQAYAARRVSAPRDEAYRAFAEQMRAHPHAGGEGLVATMYEAQCLKDDTMAESIADWRERMQPQNPLVVHYAGAFHIERGRGTAARVRERAARSTVRTVILVPDADPARVDPATLTERGDFVVVYPE